MKKLNLIFLSVFFFSFTCSAQRTDTIRVKVHDHEMALYASGEGKELNQKLLFHR